MESGSDPLRRLVAAAISPDQRIQARVSGGDQVEVWFRSGAYPRYDDDALAHQLAQLATRLWVEYRRAYFQALSEAVGETIRGDTPTQSPRTLAFRQELAALPLDVTSPGGWIRIRSEGLVRWQIHLARGACRQLTEDDFLAELDRGYRALITEYYQNVLDLKDRLYDLRRPESNTRRRDDERAW